MHGPAPTIDALIEKIRIVRDADDLQVVLRALAPAAIATPTRIAFVNAHAFNLCHTNSDFLAWLLECDYVVRDGAGMKILFTMLGRDPGINMNGTDFIPMILDLYKGQRIALFGTDSPHLERAAEKIRTRGLDVVHVLNGFQEPAIYGARLKENVPSLTILAMGMPKQERVAAMIARDIPGPQLIVCGGAILDFIAEKVARAPEIFRKHGLEWLYRLGQEPARLFSRYVIGNFSFLARAFDLARHKRQTHPQGVPQKLRVLHVVRQYPPAIGGLESYVQSMTKHQQRLGCECEVLTLNTVFHGDGRVLPSEENLDGVKVHRVGFWGRRRFFLPKVSPFFFGRYDAVHVHNTDCFYDYVALWAMCSRVPCFATTHGGFFHTKDFSLVKEVYFNTITRFSSLWYKTIFAISGNDYNMFKGLNRHVLLQPNAVEPLGETISTGQDFIYIGRLAQHKQVERIIAVFAHLKQDHGVAGTLHIVGPEWDVTLNALQAAAVQNGVEDSVAFYGNATRADIERIAQQCGYFLSASTFEGFGMSMLEAMSVGMIPFVEGNESFTELVAQSGLGLCVNYAAPADAAAQIAAAIGSVTPEDRVQAQNFARKFSWDVLARKTVQQYEQAVRA